MQFEDLIGKTITAADLMKLPRYDDAGWLRLTFSDGTSCVIVSSGDEYTGDSVEEYRQEISIVDHVDGLVTASAQASQQTDDPHNPPGKRSTQ